MQKTSVFARNLKECKVKREQIILAFLVLFAWQPILTPTVVYYRMQSSIQKNIIGASKAETIPREGWPGIYMLCGKTRPSLHPRQGNKPCI